MTFIEEHGDLFTVPQHYYLAHCISSDCALGRGIAVEFNRRFNLRSSLKKLSGRTRKYPTCILIGRVFNLITKENYWDKPTYETLHLSLLKMKAIAEDNGITHIAMPTIGSGLDKLNWDKVKVIIEEVFYDTNINILVRHRGKKV